MHLILQAVSIPLSYEAFEGGEVEILSLSLSLGNSTLEIGHITAQQVVVEATIRNMGSSSD